MDAAAATFYAAALALVTDVPAFAVQRVAATSAPVPATNAVGGAVSNVAYAVYTAFIINNNSLLNVQFGSLLGPRRLLLIYIWGENST